MAQRDLTLAAQRQDQRLSVHIRIAVAIAADPGCHAEKGGDLDTTKLVLELGIKLRNLPQEGRLVISERVLDLVVNAQMRIAQEPRLPKLRDPGTQQHSVAFSLPLAWSVSRSNKSCAIERSASRWLLRWTSVGCAVRTGDTRLQPSFSAMAFLPKPAAVRRSNVAARLAILERLLLLLSTRGMAPDIMPVLGNMARWEK